MLILGYLVKWSRNRKPLLMLIYPRGRVPAKLNQWNKLVRSLETIEWGRPPSRRPAQRLESEFAASPV